MVVPDPACDFASYAQEFLRRNEAYRAAWLGMQRHNRARRRGWAQAWGLAFSVQSRCYSPRHAGTLAADMASRHTGPGRGASRHARPVTRCAQRQPLCSIASADQLAPSYGRTRRQWLVTLTFAGKRRLAALDMLCHARSPLATAPLRTGTPPQPAQGRTHCWLGYD